MAHLSSTASPSVQGTCTWRRRVRRSWARPRDMGHPATLLAQIPSLPRAALARLATQLIDRLDDIDGDLDLEFNGDEVDGTAGEDDFYPHSNWLGAPGCPIADPDTAVDDHPSSPGSQETRYA